ncbi:MAG: sle [Amycolatopsis sp.]|jgi:flavin reductase (DIM6/NTAB) family NADH-FMN oxidoreductase RutF|uniref:flavin reductase family protein n=1 Tax=Amycolatopsis sp. TaxID=37632 RepID=UPI0026272EEE|nr:flavin reductase family protein [Amycolatopsis sp.]MCU1681728.1 sle [Amycolatopsis sp.]
MDHSPEHVRIEPAILYFGTPVVLISTMNPDETVNLAPMSSAFWLGWRGVLGLAMSSQTTQNLLRTNECVLNLPSAGQVEAVDKLARTTGTYPVPDGKKKRGYRHENDKFGISGLTPTPSETVRAPRVKECPVNLEAVVEAVHPIAEESDDQRGGIVTFEVRIQKVHAHPEITATGAADRIDPDKWRPLIMSFQHFYGLGERLHPSTLAKIPEALYRSPDVDRARALTN